MPSNTHLAHRSEAAELLQQTLSRPIYNRTLRKDVGRGELDYEIYLRTTELLALQTPPSQLVVPDELLFQVIHQTQELWLKCAAFEATTLVDNLERRAAVRCEQRARPHRADDATGRRADPRAVHACRRPAFTPSVAASAMAAGWSRRATTRYSTAADAAWEALERLLSCRGVGTPARLSGARLASGPASHLRAVRRLGQRLPEMAGRALHSRAAGRSASTRPCRRSTAFPLSPSARA